ncbi:Type II secretion envelope pseudopilin protein (PulG,guides folded protein to PulD in outer membrane) [hydrothermal vent metagenome]|uniref:Type II secretion envelope pseudopilin protein (PulG,guides folded protein to PulD in outer membrane) n=1 Tax=hydrothermal vent metagenome TaxID=652676 RepID=A0A1W1C3N5_9ZZZZ
MKRSHSAFTMIELVFVIVILGILAAVAIPKLAATRDDAKISKIAMNIMSGAAEIAEYATSHAAVDDNLSVMSNGISSLVDSGDAVLKDDGSKAEVKMGSVSDCVIVEVASGEQEDNLTVSFGDANGDSKCSHLQSAIDASKYPMKLRGTSVNY